MTSPTLDMNKGFTILELIVVLAMITIMLVIMLGNFRRAQTGVGDDAKITQFRLMSLALEQYRSQCKVYPEDLAPTTHNGYPTTSGSQIVCPPLESYLPSDVDVSLFNYTALRSSGTPVGYCSAYHLSIQLTDHSTTNAHLATDSDWMGSSSQASCAGMGTSLSPSDDTQGFYDIHYPAS